MRPLFFLLLVVSLWAWLHSPAMAKEGDISITYMPFSYHHIDDPDVDNETHHGVGINYNLPDDFTIGVMTYKNSYSKRSVMFHVAREFAHSGDWHFGAGAGMVNGYDEHLMIPMLAWGSVRYKWLQINHVPLQVTTVSINIPIN